MIIDCVKLENFGVYAGEQSIELTPPSIRKPITLIGGLNGGGKTTLLDAIQLCLYGKFANCSKREKLSFHDFLKRCIHSGSAEKAASVGLQFTATVNGLPTSYDVKRSWYVDNEKVLENFAVYRDGILDVLLAENWLDAVEHIFPRRIANLFLFDGEKIEDYATPERASELIKSAILNLLGLELVDQLIVDLDALAARKSKLTSDAELRAALDDAQSELDRLSREKRKIKGELVRLKTHRLDRLQKRLSNADLEFQSKGGVLFELQNEIENELRKKQSEKDEGQIELRALASGDLPLLLVKDLLSNVLSRARDERQANLNQEILSEMLDRDKRLLDHLRNKKISGAATKTIKSFLESDNKQRSRVLTEDSYLDLSHRSEQELGRLLDAELAGNADAAAELTGMHDSIDDQISVCEAKLASVPAEVLIKALIIERKTVKDELAQVNSEVADLEGVLKSVAIQHERTKGRLVNLIKRGVEKGLHDEDELRIINYASRTQRVMEDFKGRAIERNLAKIEGLILQCMDQLLRKRDLISGVRIDSKTFHFQALGTAGEVLPLEQFSAGERQLIVVAIIWGLALSSGRHLPTIIDTPLGRLDSQHRSKILRAYLPNASHQVILLSTDEEITDNYLDDLRPYIGHTYELQFDSKAKSTLITNGYFGGEL